MTTILKIWLRFPSDDEDSYTSLPCTPEMIGSELAAKVVQSIKNKRNMTIDVSGESATNQPGASTVWQMAWKQNGMILKLNEPVLTQLNEASVSSSGSQGGGSSSGSSGGGSSKDLRLVLAPEQGLPKFSVGDCVWDGAMYSPAQAFITYLVSSGQLPLVDGAAFSRRCFEDGITGLQECIAGLTESETDSEALKTAIGPERHARILQTVQLIKNQQQPEELQAFLKPPRRKGGHRMRSIIVNNPHQVVATIHAAPKASIAYDHRIQQNGSTDLSSTTSSSIAPAPSPSSPTSSTTSSTPAATTSASPTQTPSTASTSSTTSTSKSSPPLTSSLPPPLPIPAVATNNPVRDVSAVALAAVTSTVHSSSIESIEATSMVAPLVTPVVSRMASKKTLLTPSPNGLPPPPPPPPGSSPPGVPPLAKMGSTKGIEIIVDSGVLVERVQEWSTVAYDVVKINERGRRQNRILRLTPTHIQNVKDTDTISSRHSYDEVLCVTLSDHETLVISYLESHDYTYVSPVALQIVGDINDRISKKREKQKATLSTNLNAMAIKFQEKMYRRELAAKAKLTAATATSAISSSTATSTSAPVASNLAGLEKDLAFGAMTLSENPLLAKLNEGGLASISDGTPDKPPTLATAASAPPPSRAPPPLPRQPSKSTMKLQQLFGTTHEQRLQLAIDTIVLESTSDIGKARARFLKNFDTLEKNPETMLSVMRRFMDSLRNHIEAKRMDEIRKVTGLTQTVNATLESLEEQEDLLSRIERSVEFGVVQPLYQRLMTVVKKQSQSADDIISAQLTALRTKIGCDQAFYGIIGEYQNVNNWSSAIEELNDMEKKFLPCEKLKCLLSTAKSIYTTFNHDRVTRAKLSGHQPKPGQYFLSADDFFPIFVFVISQSNLTCLDTTRAILWALCDKNQLNGEGGYYLTVFEAAAEYIKNVAVVPSAK